VLLAWFEDTIAGALVAFSNQGFVEVGAVGAALDKTSVCQ
jgi:hypothetical protein